MAVEENASEKHCHRANKNDHQGYGHDLTPLNRKFLLKKLQQPKAVTKSLEKVGQNTSNAEGAPAPLGRVQEKNEPSERGEPPRNQRRVADENTAGTWESG